MTKEEKIKEAYIEVFGEKRIRSIMNYVYKENGFIEGFVLLDLKLDIKNEKLERKFNGVVYSYRPKSLKGLEKNNGWTKIENESDLPTIGEYYTIASFDNSIVEREFPHPKFSLEFNKEWWLKHITHYQQIIKPENPLY